MRDGHVPALVMPGVILMLVVGAVPVAGATRAPGGTVTAAAWKLQGIPAPVIASGRLTGVSCSSAGACTAVGFYDNVPGNGTLAEAWDGTSWSIQAAPDPAGATASVLDGVSCPAPGSCMAVGSYQNAAGTHVTLAEAWNGTSWSILATPNPAGARRSYFWAVSCAVATACTATGSYQNAAGTHVTLAEAWNGTSWSIQPTPSPSATRNSLFGVSCTSPISCTAVGAEQQAPDRQAPLAEAWNGTSWSVQPMPSPAAGATLSAVSCTSASACTAAGTVAEAWNGTSWHIEQTFPGASLSGISCPTAGFCLAAGSVIEAWNGSSWTAIADPAGVTASPVATSCTSASACTLVGYNQPPAQPIITLAEAWDGTSLSVQPAPNPNAVTTSDLDGVSCASATACAAVGDFNDSAGGLLPLAEVRAGPGWSIEPVPLPPGAAGGSLNAVSCPSPSECMAVGWYENGASDHFTLAEIWNGTAWSVQPSPSPSASANALHGVSCTSAGVCAAVGDAGGSTLVETWNGTSWSVRHSVHPRAVSSQLAAVSCVSAAACTAVGSYDNTSGGHGLAEAWNGSSWSLQRFPAPPGSGISVTVHGVSCTSAAACTAVGSYVGTGPSHALAAGWNGTAWSLQTIPLPRADGGSFLTGVSCISAGACTAAGGSAAVPPLAAAWNGTAWSVQRTPVPAGSLASDFNGVSCGPAGPCLAVGGHANSIGAELPLGEARS